MKTINYTVSCLVKRKSDSLTKKEKIELKMVEAIFKRRELLCYENSRTENEHKDRC